MKKIWEITEFNVREFNKLTAIEGDMYWYHDGKLVYTCNAIENPKKPSLFNRMKWRKRSGGCVIINRRTVEYIYEVTKGVEPGLWSKEAFVDCVMGTIPPYAEYRKQK